jgi:hypothetical protein
MGLSVGLGSIGRVSSGGIAMTGYGGRGRHHRHAGVLVCEANAVGASPAVGWMMGLEAVWASPDGGHESCQSFRGLGRRGVMVRGGGPHGGLGGLGVEGGRGSGRGRGGRVKGI